MRWHVAPVSHRMCVPQAGEKVLSLEWLRDRSAEEARAYLRSIDGAPSAYDHMNSQTWLNNDGQHCMNMNPAANSGSAADICGALQHHMMHVKQVCHTGLGQKSVACILLLCLRAHDFPVDTNVGRICARMGWLPFDQEKPLEVGNNHVFGVERDPFPTGADTMTPMVTTQLLLGTPA